VILPTALGVLTVELHGAQTHQWATGVRLSGLDGQLSLEWFEDEHPHTCAVVGTPRTWASDRAGSRARLLFRLTPV
jgi:hypothetical protein